MKYFILLLVSFNLHAFDWQGHRGARGLYPENTIEGMREALKYPVTTLELDVVVTKDREVVVSHEPWMNGEICLTPEGKEIKGEEINLYKMSYNDIRKYDCGSKIHPRFQDQQKAIVGKPLLSELIGSTEDLLRKLNRQSVSYNLEIKSTPEDEKRGYQPSVEMFSDLVVETLKKVIPPERFTIQSFDWRVLKYIHKKYPEIRLVALREEAYSASAILKELGFNPQVFSPYYKLLTAQDVATFQQKNIKVIPWTVNTISEMRFLRGLGVDGIITDYPNLITEASSKACDKGHNQFEGKCIKLPENALPSTESPGWVCRHGFVQQHLHCEKMAIPDHAKLKADGKNWECEEGYSPYRGSCKK